MKSISKLTVDDAIKKLEEEKRQYLASQQQPYRHLHVHVANAGKIESSNSGVRAKTSG